MKVWGETMLRFIPDLIPTSVAIIKESSTLNNKPRRKQEGTKRLIDGKPRLIQEVDTLLLLKRSKDSPLLVLFLTCAKITSSTMCNVSYTFATQALFHIHNVSKRASQLVIMSN